MPEWLLIAGFAAGWIVSVPFMARWFWEPGDEWLGGTFPVFMALLIGFAWPPFAAVAALWWFARCLAPFVLREEGSDRER